METNKGIIVNGGNFTADNVISGDNGTINYTNTDLQQLSSLFEELFNKLQSPGEEVVNKADVLDAISVLKEEIKKPEPQKNILKVLGKSVLDNLGYVKALAPIAETIWKHISSFIG